MNKTLERIENARKGYVDAAAVETLAAERMQTAQRKLREATSEYIAVLGAVTQVLVDLEVEDAEE